VRVLLDTSTFIWAVTSPDRLSRKATESLALETTERQISSVSLSELAIKQAKGKLKFSKAEVQAGVSDLRLRLLPYNAAHAYHLFDLPLHHTDPFDRMIIAQALAEDMPVVSSDNKFRLYKELRVIW
jgi:PIN domain nuclease of toxin-antitoxin system